MRAFLHKDFTIAGHTLRDTRLDCGYALTPDAAWVIGQLEQESHTTTLVRRIARLRRIPEAEAMQAVYSTCGQLGRMGGLRIEWDRSFGKGIRLQARMRWRHREPVSAAGFMRSMLRAYGVLCAGMLGLFGYGRFIMGEALAWWLLIVPIAVFVSCVIHEAGHVMVAHRARVPAVLLSGVGYMALMYRRPARGVMRRIALAGPLSVVIVCALSLFISWSPFMWFVLVSVACTHAFCLLPVCADGKAIWR